MKQLPPLILEPRLDSRIWGGATLGPWLALPDAPSQLAEAWLVYDQNPIRGGPFDGRTLADLAAEYGADLLGSRTTERGSTQFPLLAKFIDAADDLSVQVHPDDAYAHRVEAATGFNGKTEAWYILRAEPGTAVIHGFNAPTDRPTFAAALHNGTLLDLLRQVPIAAGDVVFVPAGTVHAIRAGTLLFEIQQTSDLTYRVYDYDRRDKNGKLRELHVDKALDVTNYDQTAPAKVDPQPLGDSGDLLVSCPYFALERWQLDGTQQRHTDPATFEIWTVIDGAAELRTDDVYNLPRGTAIVLPANLGAFELRAQGNATLLRCYVPASS
jgi:mannose-6-phosphate isomerase